MYCYWYLCLCCSLLPTLAFSLFSAAPRIRLQGVASMASDILFLVCTVVRTPFDGPTAIAEEVEGLWNIVGTASDFHRLFFAMPNVAAMVESTSKESSVKCSMQMNEYFVTVHCACVHCTCFTHFSRSAGSLGNLYRLMPSPGVFEQPATTQRFTILLTSLSICTAYPVLWYRACCSFNDVTLNHSHNHPLTGCNTIQ